MPAEFEAGFSVRKPMWHGLGEVLPDYTDRETAFAKSGQNWMVEQQKLLRLDQWGVRRPVEGHFAAVRSDNAGLLGIHQDTYEVLQNFEGWDLAEAIVDQDRALQYETAMALKEGKVCCVLIRDESFTVPGDDSQTIPYLLVSWAHDGTAAMVATATNVRVVCWNTLNLALKSGQQRFSFRHTKNVRDRIAAATHAVTGMRRNTELYKQLTESLAKRTVSADDVLDFTATFIPMPEDAKGASKGAIKARAKTAEQRNKFLGYLTSESVPENLRFTKYGLLQAGVEYLDWSGNSRTQETRFNRVLLTGDAPKQRLLELVGS